MKKSKILLFVLILFISTSFIFAGYYFEQQSTSSGPRGEKTKLNKTWLESGKIRIDSNKVITIIDSSKNTVLMIQPTKKTYSQMSLDKFQDMVSMGMKMMKQMMKSKNNGIKVTITGETKVIDGYPCYKVITNMFGIKTISWYSKKVGIPREMYMEISKITMSKEDFDALTNNPEFKKIKGFPVESTTTMSFMGMNMKTVTKLIKFTKMNIPSSIFNYNLSGFTKKDVNMGRGGM